MNRYGVEVIRPVWAEIDLEAIRYNLAGIRRLVGPEVEIMAVVKAEAYGHGAIEIARTVINNGASWLGVSLPEEGIALRKAGIKTPILVFEPLQSGQTFVFLEYDLTATVCIPEIVAILGKDALKAGKIAQVHVKVDTGMGRVGVKVSEAAAFIREINELSGIKVNGLYSHLATADERDKNYATKQIKAFSDLARTLKMDGLLPEKVHLANSAAIIDLPEAYFNMVRPGIMLYGLYPSAQVHREKISLKPAMSLKTKSVFVKRVPENTGISYGLRYHTRKETTIVTIPIGYADGWSRLLAHKAEALIGGKRFPIVGTICMDQCMIDVGDEPVELGQEIVLIGEQGCEKITADIIADHLGTINYEVTCMISSRVPRIYVASINIPGPIQE
jgi:alanine racemase